MLAAWWLLLGAAALLLPRSLRLSGDLTEFMPPPASAEQRVVLEQISRGPASRLLLLAIDGAPPRELAGLSRALAQSLRTDSRFRQVWNGATTLRDIPTHLLAYRYLLSPNLDHADWSPDFLRTALLDRLADLASTGAAELKQLIPRDPTLELVALAEHWTPHRAPQLRDGVWFSPRGEALLLAETRAPGFDAAAQTEALDALHTAFRALPHSATARLSVTGPGYFSARLAATTRAEAERLSLLGTLGFAVLLLFAYRSASVLALVALPLASGMLAGLAALAIGYGAVHGITLAFGFTLLGVAQEYPLRVFSHRRADARDGIAAVWPLLRLTIVSTAIAYAAFYVSGVPGLQQLAVFTLFGLLVAGAATRHVLPHLLPNSFRDCADQPWTRYLARWLAALPRWRGLALALTVFAVAALALAPTPTWQNDLSALTPLPANELRREAELRAALAAPDVRYLLLLEAADADGVLALGERIAPAVERLLAAGAAADIELPSRYLPSIATQRARQARLPDRDRLARALETALAGLPFRAEQFTPFLDDVASARSLEPLTPARLAETPLGQRLQTMLVAVDGRCFGLGALYDVRDPAALAAFAAATPGVHLLDLKAASEALVAAYRTRILWALAGALALLGVAVTLALHDVWRAVRVLGPMTLATLLAAAVLRLAGVSLSLFHLVALALAAGLGLHYALFFERPVADAAEARRTLHATVVCVLAAVLVFGLLATSALPVLRAIGLTVALGVAFHFLLSVGLVRPR
jgi:predicted exporter